MAPTPTVLRTALFLAIALGAVARTAAADTVFAPVAAEILDDLRAADLSGIPAESGYGRPTVRVHAFRENRVPIPADTANDWNRRLLRELHRQAGTIANFVNDTAVDALVGDIERSARPASEKADRIADLVARTRPDILLSGRIVLSGATPVLSYQAVSAENGRLIASSAPRRMAFPEIATPRPVSEPAPAARPIVVADGPYGYRATTEEAERLLRALGYDPGPVDGVLTAETRRALRAYQLDSALPVHGRMTPRTVENMRRDTR